nr:SEC-C metal-binding domain-containing protein [Lentibacillus sp. JNUCC-1]
MKRNDPCHCGSGKKYKKCCMDRDEKFSAMQAEETKHEEIALLSYEEVNALTTDEIIEQLQRLGVPFDEQTFLKDVERFYSAEEVSDHWFDQYSLVINGPMEDFPWFAAWVLWDRLAPRENISMEHMDDLIIKGTDYLEEGKFALACDEWWKVWEGITYRIDRRYKDFDYLDDQYSGTFSIRDFFHDLEYALLNAGSEDTAYLNKRIQFCEAFCTFFPEADEEIYHSMRRAIIDSYGELGDFDKADAECKQLAAEFPKNPWSYTVWGDLLYIHKEQDLHRAKELYEKAISLAKDKMDAEMNEERLIDLKQEL